MKLPTQDDSDRGQVGIGTLIIFIALVLVAAVAAGVLINTAGELQSRASDTGDDAQSQVSNQIDVVSATGVVNTGNDGVKKITLVVKKSAGSEPIDLKDATIKYTSGGSSKTLTYVDGSADGESFTTETIRTDGPTTVLSDNGERVKIVISTADIATEDPAEGESIQLQIVDQSGASTVYGVNIPDVITSEDDYVTV